MMRIEKKNAKIILSAMLTILVLIIPFAKVVNAETSQELISSGVLSDEFNIQITERIALKNLKPTYENNELSFVGDLENKTDKVAQIYLSGKLVLGETKEEIGMTFENEVGANSTIENVVLKTDGQIPNLNLNQDVNRSIKVDYTLTGNTTSGEGSREHNNYVEKEKTNYLKDLFLVGIPLLSLIISYAIWNSFGRDLKVTKKETYHPIKDTNSMELAYLFQDKCDNNDIASLIIYLANEGFISIEETDLKDGYKNKVFKLKKVKDYDLKDSSEKLIMETLFKDRKEVTTDVLGNSLHDIKKEIKANMKVKYSDEKMYTKGELFRKVYISLLIVISVIVIIVVPKMNLTDDLLGIREAIILLVLLLFGIMPAFLDIGTKRAEKLELYTYMVVDVILMAAFIYFIRGSFIISRHLYEAIFAGAFILVMLLLLYSMPKKKEKYAEKYQRIVEFKEFMKEGSQEKLAELVKKDSDYFYTLLPYATSLEVEDEWIAKSDGIVKAWPKWFKKPDGKYETEKFMRKYGKIIETLEFYAGNK